MKKDRRGRLVQCPLLCIWGGCELSSSQFLKSLYKFLVDLIFPVYLRWRTYVFLSTVTRTSTLQKVHKLSTSHHFNKTLGNSKILISRILKSVSFLSTSS